MQKNSTSTKRYLLGKAYTSVIKPVFFLFDAELVHDVMTNMGYMLGKSAVTRIFTRSLFYYGHPSLQRTFNGITFSNPIGLAAGFDYDAKLPNILPDLGFGFMTIGTVTARPYKGNTVPRLQRFPNSQSLLINKGFKSQGADVIIQKLEGREFRIPVGISIGSTNSVYHSLAEQIADIKKTFQLFEKSDVRHKYYELNISCPNTQGGQPFTTAERLGELLKVTDTLKLTRPLFIKMPIDLGKEMSIALLKAADVHNVQGVIFGNLTKDKTNPDVDEKDREKWLVSPGNLSGKPTFKRSNMLIALTKKRFGSRFTIIGTGGTFSPEDAQKKLALGADLVQLITGMIYKGPQLIGEINECLV